MQHRLRQQRTPPTRKQARQNGIQRRPHRLRLPRRHLHLDQALHHAQTPRLRLLGRRVREVQAHREVAQVDALRVQEFLVYGVVEGEVVGLDALPELRAVGLAEEHYCFACACAEVIRLFDALYKQIMDLLVLVVELNELFDREAGEVDCEAPWEGLVFVFDRGVVIVLLRRVGRVGGLGARVQVVEEAERVVPFQRDAVVGEPDVGWCGGREDEGGLEEGVEGVREEGEVG
jgi:hypothetical protein